ncbi:MAG TPA: Gfo/Idh/MocA family oxidoreductase [Ignavibacteriaceae bacterium]|nr:Gfo/Idh/MocA family oxidoreductase [Ignavibacteriaceae bacterium]
MLNGAIIGFGKIAQGSHVKAFFTDALKDKVKLVAAVEPIKENRDKEIKDYPSLKFYHSTEELFANEKIDFIDITAPPKFHSHLIKEGIKNKVNILCEKPFTLTLDEANETYKLLSESDLVFMPCHQYRYSPTWQNFKSFLNENPPGSKSLLQFNVFRMQADQGGTAFRPGWRTDKSLSGGGILADTGVHYLYLVNWLCGKPIKVSANVFNLNHPEYKVEDTAVVNLEFEKAFAEITLTWGADRRVNTARVVSNSGSLSYDGSTQLKKYSNGDEEIITVPEASDKSHYFSLYISLINEFVNRIQNNESSEDFRNEALTSIQLLEKCYESARTNRTINLDE